MIRISILFLLITFLSLCFAQAQRKNINGQLISTDEVEGLHIQNKSAAKYTISNEDGSFVILAQALDTLEVSGVKYQTQHIVISKSIIEIGQFNIHLIEKLNELHEVVLGTILTGSLESDIENSKTKPEINFYDLGIEASTDLPATQSEQRLYDADHGQFAYYYGIAIVINVHKILNRINGDTKEYKERVRIESNEDCINRFESEYSKTIFDEISIPEKHRAEFFQYCLEDIKFDAVCKDENNINDVSFLLEKLKIFKNQLNEED